MKMSRQLLVWFACAVGALLAAAFVVTAAAPGSLPRFEMKARRLVHHR